MNINDLSIPKQKLSKFCKRWQIAKLELFGSAVKGDFTDSSDIDLLVEYKNDYHRTLSDQIEIQKEIEELFGRKVDLIVKKTIENSPNPFKRKRILGDTREIYAQR